MAFWGREHDSGVRFVEFFSAKCPSLFHSWWTAKKKIKKNTRKEKKKHNNFKQPQGMIQQYYSVEFIMEQNLKGG